MDGIEYLIDILEGVDSYLENPLAVDSIHSLVLGKFLRCPRTELHNRVKRALAEFKSGELRRG